LFITYAAITAVPVILLGVALGYSYRNDARQSGVAEGRSEAQVVAKTAVEPLLDGRPLGQGLSPAERAAMSRLVKRAVGDHDILRLRLQSVSGHVVYSDDGSGFSKEVDDEAVGAAHGEITARLTHLNADSDDVGLPLGPQAVEVYLPLTAGSPEHVVGVFEVYLPYAPIAEDVGAGLHTLYRDLALGLGALYIVLFLMSVSVSRRLRQQVKENKFLAEHDPLTELPNRSLFHQRAQEAVVRAVRGDSRAAIAIVDLDRFKEVNDTLGHDSGDQLLTLLAQRLADHTRPRDAVARLGGDEFGVILSEVGDAEEVLRRLRDIIEREVEVSGLPCRSSRASGTSSRPTTGSTWTTSSSTPMSPCTSPRPSTSAWCATTRATTTTTHTTSASSPSCDVPSTPASWSCTTSPRPPSRTGGSKPSKLWCAGSTPRSACCTRTGSSPCAGRRT